MKRNYLARILVGIISLFCVTLFSCVQPLAGLENIYTDSSIKKTRMVANTIRIGYLWFNLDIANAVLIETMALAGPNSNNYDAYYKSLTHLNLSFVNPISNKGKNIGISENGGSALISELSIQNLVKALKKKYPSLRIGLAVGGSYSGNPAQNLNSIYKSVLDNGVKQNLFTTEVLRYAKNTGCDYIDIDLEWKALSIIGYNKFVQNCYDLGKKQGINTTLTLEYLYPAGIDYGNNKQQTLDKVVSNVTLQKCDLLNIMSYNYNDNDSGNKNYKINDPNHAPLKIAERDINFFIAQGVDAGKIILGLPFFGKGQYATGTEQPVSNMNDPTLDIQKIGGNPYYFNGTETIKSKLKLARMKGIGGVMFWSIRHDKFGDYKNSMLKVIVDNQ